MHRVELKVFKRSRILQSGEDSVPNAPCGVESQDIEDVEVYSPAFLMHRVELKAFLFSSDNLHILTFLMHRVELKGRFGNAG